MILIYGYSVEKVEKAGMSTLTVRAIKTTEGIHHYQAEILGNVGWSRRILILHMVGMENRNIAAQGWI